VLPLDFRLEECPLMFIHPSRLLLNGFVLPASSDRGTNQSPEAMSHSGPSQSSSAWPVKEGRKKIEQRGGKGNKGVPEMAFNGTIRLATSSQFFPRIIT